MLTKKERKELNKERQKLLFLSEIESGIKRLDFQRKRILEWNFKNNFNGINVNHDADFYMILLRRLFRRIENIARRDSRVANLKGKFSYLYKKIKIRDHFEHEIDYKKIPQIYPGSGIICIGGVVINKTNPHIISGDQKWLLNEDHENFKELLKEFISFFPFITKTKTKIKERQSPICYILMKLIERFCKFSQRKR